MNNTISEFGLHLLEFIQFKQEVLCTLHTLQGNYDLGITLLK